MSRALGPRPPLAAGQRRARVGADHHLLGAGRPGLAGVGRRPARRRPGRRPHSRRSAPAGYRPCCTAAPRRHGPVPRRPWSPRQAPSWPLSWPRSRSSRGGSSPAASPGPATRSPRSAGTGPCASSPAAPGRRAGHPAAALAGRRRPSRLAPADIGLVLGGLKQPGGNGPDLYASWEDTLVAFMGPRSGKTTSLGIPYVLSAPGAVIATSNKSDLWAATARTARRPGLARVGVRPAAHHRRRAALVVEPAGRADQRRGRPPARQPLRPYDRRRQQARHLGASRPGAADQPAAGRRGLRAHAAGGVPLAGRPGRTDSRRAAGRRRIPGAGIGAARRTAWRPRDPRRHLPDGQDRGQVPARRGDHGLGHPASRPPAAGVRPVRGSRSPATRCISSPNPGRRPPR